MILGRFEREINNLHELLLLRKTPLNLTNCILSLSFNVDPKFLQHMFLGAPATFLGSFRYTD